jgi:hypothetical protein
MFSSAVAFSLVWLCLPSAVLQSTLEVMMGGPKFAVTTGMGQQGGDLPPENSELAWTGEVGLPDLMIGNHPLSRVCSITETLC